MKREEKIKLLKAIESGEKSVKSLRARVHEVWYKLDGGGFSNTDPCLFNNEYYNRTTEKKRVDLTEVQFRQRQRERGEYTTFISIEQGDRKQKKTEGICIDVQATGF